MKSKKWDKKYSIGIPEIDFQHQFFFLLIDRIEHLIDQRCHKVHISNLMDELVKYAIFHFASEENRMFINKYDGLYSHKLSHLDLINKLNVVKTSYEYFNIGIGDIVPFLADWLTKHTLSKDMEFGNYMKQIDNCELFSDNGSDSF